MATGAGMVWAGAGAGNPSQRRCAGEHEPVVGGPARPVWSHGTLPYQYHLYAGAMPATPSSCPSIEWLSRKGPELTLRTS